MDDQAPDFAYSLAFLQKLNQIEIIQRPIKNTFFIGEYNLWQLYQQMLFEDIKSFSKARIYEIKKRNFLTLIKDITLSSLVVFDSLAGALTLIFSKRKIAIYSVDVISDTYKNDSRLSDLYKVLEEKRIRYLEIIHTTLSRRLVKNFLLRKRPTIYLESFYIISNIIFGWRFSSKVKTLKQKDLEIFSTSAEKSFAESLLIQYEKRAYLTAKVVPLLSFVIRKSGLKAIFAIDDYRYSLEVILASRLAGIKTIALQHGHITKYQVGWLKMEGVAGEAIAPDTFLVWSDYWKKELERLNSFMPSEKVIVGGWSKNQALSKNDSGNLIEQRKQKTVLIPYETAAPKAPIKSLIEKLILGGEYKIIFKLRADIKKEEQLAQYGLENMNHVNFSIETNGEKALAKCNALIGVYSTFLYDGVLRGVPVGILLSASDYGEGMVTNNLAENFSVSGDVAKEVEKLLRIRSETLEERKKKLLGEKPLFLYDTLLNIAEGIVKEKIHA